MQEPDRIADLIERLAEQLGTTGEHLWSVLVNHAPIDGAARVASGSLGLLIGVVLLVAARKMFARGREASEASRNPYGDDGGAAWYFATAASVTVAIILGLFGVESVINGAVALLDPDYWALSQILRAIG